MTHWRNKHRITSVAVGLASIFLLATTAGAQRPNVGKPPPPGAGPAVTGAAGGAGDKFDASQDEALYSCRKHPRRARITVTLKPETNLKDLVTWVMGFTCKNFLYSSAIANRSSKVTIVAPSKMSPRDAYKLFLISLQSMNLTIVPKGKTYEVIESPRAKEAPLPLYKGSVPFSDQIVRAIIRPEYVAPEELTSILNALKTKDGIVTPMPNHGVVLITDTGQAINRMKQVLREIDQPSPGERVYFLRIRYADAEEVAQKLNEIFGAAPTGGRATGRKSSRKKKGRALSVAGTTRKSGSRGGGGSSPSKIISDERTNSLVIVASNRAYARIVSLVSRLDVAVEGGAGRIHVYYLANSDAEELSGTLGALISGQASAGSRGGSRARAGNRAGRNTRTARKPAVSGSQPGVGAFEGNVRVTHDKPTNALVIVSSVKDFISLRSVIRQLDKPRRQVFIEATILEISLDKTRRMGISFHGGKAVEVGGEDALLFGGVQHRSLGSIGVNPESLIGLAAGIQGAEIPESQQLVGLSVPSFGVMFQFLQNNNDVNVLSSPHILTTDNEEAEITVGQNIPFQSGITGIPGVGGGQNGGAGFPIQSVQRQDVALTLKITPHVNDSDFVRLEIEQEINDIASLNFGGLGPSWTKRLVKTTVIVKDQQPIVIGGLMSDKVILDESKVPLLGDIPILGFLFKYQQKTKQKTNLLIFLTPYIIHNQSDLRRIFEKKTRERREFIEAFTSFDAREFETDIDYGRKRGLVEEINKAILLAEDEERMVNEALRGPAFFQDGPVDESPPAQEPEATQSPAPESNDVKKETATKDAT